MKDQPIFLNVGDVVILKKPHPCGSYRWEVVRIGAEIGIVCMGCGRRVMISRPKLRKVLKKIEGFENKNSSKG